MPTVIGIRFKDSGKIYYFDPNQIGPLKQGEYVVVDTVRGPELAKVAYEVREVPQDEIVGELKGVIRRAEQADFERLRTLNARQGDLLARCAEKIAEHNLPMRLVKAEYSFDGSRLTFYFTAEKRVDFRLLVRDLARLFHTRIELRQIGPRDEAKLLGGIGPCGRLLCCATFLPDYARVSIKMAKDQDLPLNPTKISGVCGRLLCCLSYEHEQYVQAKATLPRRGAWVQTPEGPGEVVSINILKGTVMVELAVSQAHEEFTPAQLGEAGEHVAAVARSRNEEGITPASASEGEAGALRRRERRPEPPPRREKHTGERRLLRDELDSPDMLAALEHLEDADDPDEPPRPSPRREGPGVTHPGATHSAASHGPAARPPSESGSDDGDDARGEAPQAPHEQAPRRRRRRGRGRPPA
jgi:cell fate regulator YaaT (PSP1 superfamily)